MKKRGFEVISAYQDQNIQVPQRATRHAAGYDFEAAADIVIPAFWKQLFQHVSGEEQSQKIMKPVLVPTGIKAYMGEDEYLQLANRSSNPLKRFLSLSNGVGVIDSDYYNNPDNEGHIMFQFTNFGLTDVTIKKGERIGQGIFLPFLKADGDQSSMERSGGFGSSGTNQNN
ncbi:dUTP diphosphatase [Enterococcus florum]|uniref:dUTP diphosphatase n=1 Tax=Enterococcus florum TaxID=2480627 RepID=A0A4P5PDQ8_9ENTE|nr:dUTP diphosphatase [Enterococcus florum]GCF94208.1 dUTP diphosphatase [Enterococcus florum]